MPDLKKLIISVRNQLYAAAVLACAMLAVSTYLLFSIFPDAYPAAIVLAVLLALAGGIWKTGLYQSKKAEAITLIHKYAGETEHSLHLLDKEKLNLAEKLQLERLEKASGSIRFPFGNLFKRLGVYAGFLAFSVLISTFISQATFTGKTKKEPLLRAERTVRTKRVTPPYFASAKVKIQLPAYTRLPSRESDNLNVSAIAGSRIEWKVTFSDDQALIVKLVNSTQEEVTFVNKKGTFIYHDRLTGSGLYAIKAYWHDSLLYQSDFYRLEALPDLAPKIEPASRELYTNHTLKDDRSLHITAKVSDDFLVKKAFIVATVARGSGENVKFREVRFPLSPVNFREANLEKVLDLKSLDFAPGDELYYYWAAIDNKQPNANFSKSDTYFVVFKDTAQIEEAELATMAVNIMPEYFRSQRQIIIDTEKLIRRQKKLPKKEFASISNEIGFDQKVLRLRYGQYLGEEFETSIGGGGLPDVGGSQGGILDAFTHKPDGGSEAAEQRSTEPQPPKHEDEHAHSTPDSDSRDPLAALMEQYVHAHDDAETNTFYEESTRSLLKMALEQMWQSELHLRMYEPQKALPFEHKALEYLKSAQHKARTFVRKSGYDPPPIKEKEKRLTGELDGISTLLDAERIFDQKTTPQLASELTGYLEIARPGKAQQARLKMLGSALSQRLIQSGPLHGGLQNWPVIGSLQKIISGKTLKELEKQALRRALYKLSDQSVRSRSTYASDQTLEKVFWKKLRR